MQHVLRGNWIILTFFSITIKEKIWLLFTQDLAFTAKSVRKRSGNKQKSICEANFAWIFACYWNGVNSNKFCDYLHVVSDSSEAGLNKIWYNETVVLVKQI